MTFLKAHHKCLMTDGGSELFPFSPFFHSKSTTNKIVDFSIKRANSTQD